MSKKHYLFSPGPVMVSERVRKAALHEDICHRVPEFERLIKRLQNNLLQVFQANDDYFILPITGSGTAANEAVIGSYFTAGKHALLINNGEFGCRLEELLTTHDVPFTHLKYEWCTPPDVAEIESCLKKEDIDAVLLVCHETSTSMINPVKEVGQLAHTYGKTFIVDGVSAVGGEDMNVVESHMDFCTTSANKCISGLPGVGIVCAKISRLEDMKGHKPKTAYLNLYNQYRMLRSTGQTLNTPSTTMFYILDEAVRELLEEGLENRIMRYKECVGMIRDRAKKLGMKMAIDEKYASNTVTTLYLPSELAVDGFIAEMEKRGYTLYPAKRHLKERNIFQIGNMGHIFPDTTRRFLDVLEQTYLEMKDRTLIKSR
jgi:2-aminoethylphosphonate-pyruvate transaminase